MAARALNILVIFDVGVDSAPGHDFAKELETEEFETERDVIKTLRKLGHETKPFGIFRDPFPLFDELRENRPDLVFNLCESVGADRNQEPNVVALLEMLKIPVTGAGSAALRLCKDKSLTKKILAFHRIKVPRFEVSHIQNPLKQLKNFSWPAIIKPLQLEASEGISQVSFVENEKDGLERLNFIHERYETDAIVEQYIEGRELYVGVIGVERLTVFPPQELFFKDVPEGEPKIYTFKAKWDEEYRKKWGIDSDKAKPIEPAVLKRIQETCKKIFRLFRLQGYARMDLRLSANGDMYFIEANPNPAIAKKDDFARSAKQHGWNYEDLIAKIVAMVPIPGSDT